jgi:hypothetical protein
MRHFLEESMSVGLLAQGVPACTPARLLVARAGAAK